MKSKITVLTLALILLGTTAAFAHPPRAVALAYDAQTGILNVTISHSTTRPKMHYINRVTVAVNGKTMEDEILPAQTGNQQTYSTSLRGLREGDSITVTAFCNRKGSKTSGLTVKAAARATESRYGY